MNRVIAVLVFSCFTFINAQEDKDKIKASIESQNPKKGSENYHNEVFTTVDKNPEPPNGIKSFREYISNNFRIENTKETFVARIITRFVVNEEGIITDIVVLNETHPQYKLGEETKRVLTNAPKWSPGIKDGKPVKCYYTLPITIQITATK